MTTREFIEKYMNNQEIAEKFKDCKSIEDSYEIAKTLGVTDKLDDYKAAAAKFREEAVKLSPAEMEAVAGGDANTTAVIVAV